MHPSAPRLPRRRQLALAALTLLAGTSATTAQVETFSWTGNFSNDQWGSSVAVVGDVDGDGTRDYAAGAPFADVFIPIPFPTTFTNVGKVQVYSGATGGVLHTWFGDFTGGDEFGASIADAGDVDDDGFADVLIGAPNGDGIFPNSGFVELRSGGTGAVIRTFQGFQSEARFGQVLAVGQLDGLNELDVAIGSPDYDVDDNLGGPFQEGHVALYRCIDGTVIRLIPGKSHCDTFGISTFCVYPTGWGSALAVMPDTNSDASGEVLVGAPLSDRLHNPPVGPSTTTLGVGAVFQIEAMTGEVRQWRTGDDEGDLFGSSVAVLENLTGSGPDHWVVGIAGDDAGGTNVGSVRIFGGSGASILGSSLSPIGYDTATLSDATGDGVADLLIGSPLADFFFPVVKTNIGRVDLYSGADGSLVRTQFGAAAGDRFGSSIASGDIDGGLDEWIVAARLADDAGSNSGTVYAYDDCTSVASWSLHDEGLAGTLGVPSFIGFGRPMLGTTFPIVISNSSTTPASAYVFFGLTTFALPFHGGTLLVDPIVSLPLDLPVGNVLLPLDIPADPLLCGIVIHVQAVEVDAGAVAGVSFTRRMEMVLGD